MPEWTKEKWCSRLSEDEILDEFQTKTGCTKYSNTQKILLNGCHLLLKEYLHEKTSVYIHKLCWKERQLFKESLQGGKFVKNLEFILIE